MRLRVFGLAAALALCFCAPPLALAQERAASAQKSGRKARKAKKPRKQTQAPPRAESSAGRAPASDKPAAPASEKQAAAAAAPSPLADDPGEVRKEGGTEVKTLEFSGLDIEGQLKTPQMLYFLNRLRAEFDRPRMPHRSFMPELQRAAQDQELR
jgi:hypothetical protein